MKKLIIFGCGSIGELAHFYFTKHSGRQVAAFTVDAAFKTSETLCGLPVVDFEQLPNRYPPEAFDLFVALSYTRINRLRAEKCAQAKNNGYTLASYVSPHATVLTQHPIGENCFILEDNTIQPFVKIGHNVTLWSGNHIGHHSVIGDHCFISSHVVVSGGVTIGPYCFLGVNATLRDHIQIGEGCVIGAGALILSDVPADSLFKARATDPARLPASRLLKI